MSPDGDGEWACGANFLARYGGRQARVQLAATRMKIIFDTPENYERWRKVSGYRSVVARQARGGQTTVLVDLLQ